MNRNISSNSDLREVCVFNLLLSVSTHFQKFVGFFDDFGGLKPRLTCQNDIFPEVSSIDFFGKMSGNMSYWVL